MLSTGVAPLKDNGLGVAFSMEIFDDGLCRDLRSFFADDEDGSNCS